MPGGLPKMRCDLRADNTSCQRSLTGGRLWGSLLCEGAARKKKKKPDGELRQEEEIVSLFWQGGEGSSEGRTKKRNVFVRQKDKLT